MTTLYTTLTSLNTELRQLMMGLTPRSRASHRFTTSKQLDDGVDWKDVEAVPRLFTVEWAPSGKPLTFGAAYYYGLFTAAIHVWYPKRGWTLDMLSDAEHIRDALKGITTSGGGQSSTTNVSYRLMDNDGAASVEETEDGNWLAIPLTAWITVEQS